MSERSKATQFKKGAPSPNPGGRSKLPEDLAISKTHTKIEIERTLHKFLAMDRVDLEVILRDPKTSMLELSVGTIIAKAAKDGDQQRLNFIFDRTIGKVKEDIHHHGEINTQAPQVIITLPDNGFGAIDVTPVKKIKEGEDE